MPADFIRFIVQFFYTSFLLFKAVVVCRPLELQSGHLTSGSAVEQNNSEYSVGHGRKGGQAAVAVFYNIYIVFFVLCCIFLLDY